MANFDAEATGRLFIFINDVRDRHGITNLAELNSRLVREDSYKKARGVKHATIYVDQSSGLEKYLQAGFLSNVTYTLKVWPGFQGRSWTNTAKA